MMREEHYPQHTVHTILEVNGHSLVVIKKSELHQELHDDFHIFFYRLLIAKQLTKERGHHKVVGKKPEELASN